MMIFLLAMLKIASIEAFLHQRFHDDLVHAEVTYQMASHPYANNEADPGPFIRKGNVVLRSAGHVYRYDLMELFGGQIIPANGECESGPLLSRSGIYFAIQVIHVGKGCYAGIRIINIENGLVAQESRIDHRFAHRFDVIPDFSQKTRERVTKIDHAKFPRKLWNSETHLNHGYTPWNFAMLYTRDQKGLQHCFALDLDEMAPQHDVYSMLPSNGSFIETGTFNGFGSLGTFDGIVGIRFDLSKDLEYTEMQTPTPIDIEHIVRKNAWMIQANQYVEKGEFDSGLESESMLPSLDDNADDRAVDFETVRKCIALVQAFKIGSITKVDAINDWRNGCNLTHLPK